MASTKLRTTAKVAGRRLANHWHDLRAVLAGYCNHNPYSPIAGEGGGYAHWRCALRRGHDGLHRFNNYVWSADGRTDYLPVPHRRSTPQQPWTRSMTLTPRQQRALDRWHAKRQAEMRGRRARSR